MSLKIAHSALLAGSATAWEFKSPDSCWKQLIFTKATEPICSPDEITHAEYCFQPCKPGYKMKGFGAIRWCAKNWHTTYYAKWRPAHECKKGYVKGPIEKSFMNKVIPGLCWKSCPADPNYGGVKWHQTASMCTQTCAKDKMGLFTHPCGPGVCSKTKEACRGQISKMVASVVQNVEDIAKEIVDFKDGHVPSEQTKKMLEDFAATGKAFLLPTCSTVEHYIWAWKGMQFDTLVPGTNSTSSSWTTTNSTKQVLCGPTKATVVPNPSFPPEVFTNLNNEFKHQMNGQEDWKACSGNSTTSCIDMNKAVLQVTIPAVDTQGDSKIKLKGSDLLTVDKTTQKLSPVYTEGQKGYSLGHLVYSHLHAHETIMEKMYNALNFHFDISANANEAKAYSPFQAMKGKSFGNSVLAIKPDESGLSASFAVGGFLELLVNFAGKEQTQELLETFLQILKVPEKDEKIIQEIEKWISFISHVLTGESHQALFVTVGAQGGASGKGTAVVTNSTDAHSRGNATATVDVSVFSNVGGVPAIAFGKADAHASADVSMDLSPTMTVDLKKVFSGSGKVDGEADTGVLVITQIAIGGHGRPAESLSWSAATAFDKVSTVSTKVTQDGLAVDFDISVGGEQMATFNFKSASTNPITVTLTGERLSCTAEGNTSSPEHVNLLANSMVKSGCTKNVHKADFSYKITIPANAAKKITLMELMKEPTVSDAQPIVVV